MVFLDLKLKNVRELNFSCLYQLYDGDNLLWEFKALFGWSEIHCDYDPVKFFTHENKGKFVFDLPIFTFGSFDGKICIMRRDLGGPSLKTPSTVLGHKTRNQTRQAILFQKPSKTKEPQRGELVTEGRPLASGSTHVAHPGACGSSVLAKDGDLHRLLSCRENLMT